MSAAAAPTVFNTIPNVKSVVAAASASANAHRDVAPL